MFISSVVFFSEERIGYLLGFAFALVSSIFLTVKIRFMLKCPPYERSALDVQCPSKSEMFPMTLSAKR